ncbi:hypothetical protein GCM10009665_06590 [Kitasatospora nipponensis]|uniref:Uncharacterized protein n=1 Tax=Kitasatospora nipponensis TaxID=258049 RepID=A0ABN1VPZ2_9ACTN
MASGLLRAFLATMEYRMLAMPKGTPSPVAGLCQWRLDHVIRRSSLLSASCGSQDAPSAERERGPEAATHRRGTAVHCTYTSLLLLEPAPAVFVRLEA